MLERLQKLADELTARRAVLLDEYLTALEVKDWGNVESMNAIDKAGRLHDIDKHITNVLIEIKALAPGYSGKAPGGPNAA